MTNNLYIGIDPGLDGAMAVLDDTGFIGVWDTPTAALKSGGKNKRKYIPALMVKLLTDLPAGKKLLGLELVHSMPKQGVSSMFSMGKGVGIWEGIIAALGIPSIDVTPQSWKKDVFNGGVGQDKDASRLRACQLFPAAAQFLARKCDDGRADAILIAAHVRNKHRS